MCNIVHLKQILKKSYDTKTILKTHKPSWYILDYRYLLLITRGIILC